MCFFLLITTIALEPLITLRGCLSLFHSTLHVLDKLSQLSIFIVLLLECHRNIAVLLLHLGYHGISLLELFLNYFELLRICKGILGPNHFLKLMSESCTFLHIELDFDLNLLLACASYVSLEPLNFVTSPLVLVLEVFHFALQIDDKVSV